MSKSRNIADLLDSNGDVKTTALDNATVSGADIKTSYEAETNAFTDTQFTKLSGIEAGATADQTQADINALGIEATSVDLGNWTITESAGVLYFAANANPVPTGTCAPTIPCPPKKLFSLE